MTEDQVTEGRMASFRANNHRAVAALEAVAGYAQAAPGQTRPLPAGPGPERDSERLSLVLCGIRHLSDQLYGLRFQQVRDTADGLYWQARTAAPGSPAGGEAGAEAIEIYELFMPAGMRRPGGIWPLDALAEFDRYAGIRGISREAAVARLTAWLVASLRHYADRQGLDFGSAMTAGLRAHAQQCLSAYGPVDTGLAPDRRPPAVLTLPASAPPFEPVVTRQGVVTSPGGAEWLLVRTTARIEQEERHGYLTAGRDLDDRRALADALATACGLPAADVLSALASRIAARVAEIEHGPAQAARLGREHGRARTAPYCDLDIDGDAGALMSALGETERMTDANHGYRLSLVIAYADAYKQASQHGLSAADVAARVATHDFPSLRLPSAGAPASPDAPGPAWAQPRPGPEHRPRRHT
jgi:hypothetical protein